MGITRKGYQVRRLCFFPPVLKKLLSSKFALVIQVCLCTLQSSHTDSDSLAPDAKYTLSRYKRGYLADRKTQFTVSSFILTF